MSLVKALAELIAMGLVEQRHENGEIQYRLTLEGIERAAQEKERALMEAHFKLADHKNREGIEIVEVWLGANMVATIYPTDEGIRVISNHIFFVERERLADPAAFRFAFAFAQGKVQ
jgi:hypothetical protein